MNVTHTALPWRLDREIFHIIGANGHPILQYEWTADAEAVVKAVNAHDKLVAALKYITSLDPKNDSATEWNAALNQCVDALAAAGEPV